VPQLVALGKAQSPELPEQGKIDEVVRDSLGIDVEVIK
jgi:hypothetical protein